MTQGHSVNLENMAAKTKIGSKTMSKLQIHSKSENDSGQPCQNGNEAPMVTINHTQESNVKNRVMGLRATSLTVQLPVSKLSGYEFMRVMLQTPNVTSERQTPTARSGP